MFIRQEHEFPVSWSVSGIYEEDCCCGHVIPLHLFVCFQQVVIKIINPVLFMSITCQKGQLLLLFSPNQMLAAIDGTIGFSFLPQDNHWVSILGEEECQHQQLIGLQDSGVQYCFCFMFI